MTHKPSFEVLNDVCGGKGDGGWGQKERACIHIYVHVCIYIYNLQVIKLCVQSTHKGVN